MKYKLDQEEKEILDAFDQGKLKRISNASQKINEVKAAARNTFNKTKRVNLRMTERDFRITHVKAREEGLPYQTLLSSIIHKYLNGRLVEKR